MTSDNAAHKEVVKVNESDNNREAEMKDSREQNETAANQWAKSKLHKSTQLDAASASQVSFAAQRIFTRRDVLLMSFRRQLIWVFPQRLAVGSVACRFGSRRLGSVRSAPRSPAPPRPALPRPALARPALPRPAPLPGVTWHRPRRAHSTRSRSRTDLPPPPIDTRSPCKWLLDEIKHFFSYVEKFTNDVCWLPC